MANQITTLGLDAQIQEIQNIASLEEMILMVKKIDALKVALDVVGTFREQALKYARLEAEALIRVVELGGLQSLGAKHRKTAEWLWNLEESERSEMIAKCADGLTIDQVYKREFGYKADLGNGILVAKDFIAEKIQTVKDDGIVDISSTTDFIKDKIRDNLVASALTDSLRGELRKAGAVCVEQGKGIYIIPGEVSSEQVKSAVMLRYESICRDLESIGEICKKSKVTFKHSDFIQGGWWATDNPYYGHILFALCSVGAISKDDEEAMFDFVEKTDFKKEMTYYANALQMKRDDLVEAEYGALQRRRSEKTAV